MARKTLLTESEIRQFMKLANLPAVGGNRLNQLAETYADDKKDPPGNRVYQEQDDLEAELGAVEDELGAEDEFADEEGAELDDLGDLEGEDDLEGLEDEGGEGGMVSVDDFMSALEDALENVLGEPVSVDDEGMGDEEELGGEEEMSMDMELGPEGGEEEFEMEDEEELVAEVARRVAARLAGANKSAVMVDQLAERILKRLTK
tara:strand:+ start:6963 stop:7574 length:612 start_codon:yes stop_codon:yes gene_type:complete